MPPFTNITSNVLTPIMLGKARNARERVYAILDTPRIILYMVFGVVLVSVLACACARALGQVSALASLGLEALQQTRAPPKQSRAEPSL
jgi:hypothetical protein